MVYDVARRVTVLFGGTPSDSATWIWNGSTWTMRSGPSGPSAFAWPAAAYDAARGRIVAFGGSLNNSAVDTTWEWDGTAWTEVATTGPKPGPLVGAAMAYDPIRREVILFGGFVAGFQATDETWAWDGTVWRKLDPLLVPKARARHAMMWDPARQRIVMLGGWSPLPGSESVWEWDGTDWAPLAATSPIADRATVGVPGPDGSGVLELGETVGVMQVARLLRWSAPTAYEACHAGDHDGDGLQGCEDPDCWARCTPECPPGVPSCSNTSARCGDGTCSALETCHACPADCGACPVVCGDSVCAPGEDCVGDCS
jgi:hypothetical protein